MKIILSGYFGFNNFGDEAILNCAVESITEKFSNAQITVFSSNPNETSKKYNVKSVYSFDIKAVISALRDCDYLVFPGGSVFQNVTSNKSLFYYLFLIFCAKFFKKKVILLSQGVGPIKGLFPRAFTFNLFRKADFISVRDKRSFDILQNRKINSKLALDFVWNINYEIEKNTKNNKKLGIQLRKWKSLDDKKLKELAAAIIENFSPEEFDYELISFQKTFDLTVLEKFAGFLKNYDTRCKVHLTSSDNIKDILNVVGGLDYLVAMRFHAGIVALKYKIPVVFLAYDIKVKSLAENLGIKYTNVTNPNFDILKSLKNEDFNIIFNMVENLLKTSKSSKELLLEELSPKKKRAQLLGVPVDILNMTEALNSLFSGLSENKGSFVVTLNPEMVTLANKDNTSMNLIKSADLVVPDGVGVVLGLKLIGVKTFRVAGIELAYQTLKRAEEKSLKVGLIGAEQDTIEKAIIELKKDMPNLNIVYSHNGYFNDDEKEQILSDLAKSEPDIVLVALGFPKQEKFISEFKNLYIKSIMIGVGGSFDVWSKKVKRAPKIFQKLGMEWFYRLISQPSRFRRIFPCIPLFLFRVIFYRKLSKKEC